MFAAALLALGMVMVSADLPEQEIPDAPTHTTFDQVTGSWWDSLDRMQEETPAYTTFDQITGSWR